MESCELLESTTIAGGDRVMAEAGRAIEYIKRVEPHVFLSVSGGRDSVAACHYALKQLREVGYDDDKVVMIYAHTPLSIDENKEYMESLADFLSVKLEVVEPEDGGWWVIEKYGFPNLFRKTCMKYWKFVPISRAVEKYAPAPSRRVEVLGIRAAESKRRMNIYSGKGEFYFDRHWYAFKAWFWLPILYWSKKQVFDYIEREGIPKNPLWGDGHSSADCVICIAYATKKDWLRLKAEHPELFEKLYELFKRWEKRCEDFRKFYPWRFVDLDEVARQNILEVRSKLHQMRLQFDDCKRVHRHEDNSAVHKLWHAFCCG